MSHRLSRFLFSLVPVLLVAVVAISAATPGDEDAGTAEPVVQAGVAPAAPAMPGAPEQAASSAKAAPGQPVASMERPAPRPGSEEAALAAIMAANRDEVAALLQRLGAATDPEDAMQLQQEIVRVKTEGRLAFLQAKIDFARERGDEVTAQDAMRARDNILNPPKPDALPFAEKRAPGAAK